MIDFIHRFDRSGTAAAERPANADEARQRLVDGNREFARLFDPRGSAESHAHVVTVDPVFFGSAAIGRLLEASAET